MDDDTSEITRAGWHISSYSCTERSVLHQPPLLQPMCLQWDLFQWREIWNLVEHLFAHLSFSVPISHNPRDGGWLYSILTICRLQLYPPPPPFCWEAVNVWSCCFESFGSSKRDFSGSESIIWSCFRWFQTACPRLCSLVFLVWL